MATDLGFLQWFKDFGFAATLLVLVLVGLWTLGRYICKRLFDADKGIVTGLVADQRQFLSHLSASQDAIHKRLSSHSEVLERIEKAVKP